MADHTMVYFVFYLLMLAGMLLLARPLTVLLHELGHAVPAIILTSKKVTIYLGSYGDPDKSFKFNLGLLNVYFRYNPFAWRMGLCVPSAEKVSVNRQIVYLLTGSITSLIIAVIACYLTFAYDLHGFLKLFLIVFIGSALLDLLVNLIPDHTPIQLFDGRITYNDGHSLQELVYYKKIPKEYLKAVALYDNNKFAEAAAIFEKVIDSGLRLEGIYQHAIVSYLLCKNYQKANEVSALFAQIGKMNSDDLVNFAISCSELGQQDKAIELYDQSLQQDPDNINTLNNKGYTLNLMDRFEEAIAYFNKTIELDNRFAYAYNNRGLSKLRLGRTEEALEDINRGLMLDPDNSYGYRNLGIYHYDKGEYHKALPLFVRSKELDAATPMIDEFIADVQQRINSISQE